MGSLSDNILSRSMTEVELLSLVGPGALHSHLQFSKLVNMCHRWILWIAEKSIVIHPFKQN